MGCTCVSLTTRARQLQQHLIQGQAYSFGKVAHMYCGSVNNHTKVVMTHWAVLVTYSIHLAIESKAPKGGNNVAKGEKCSVGTGRPRRLQDAELSSMVNV